MKLPGIMIMCLMPGYSQAQIFEDISDSAGIDATHTANTFGIGQAWIDVDNNGFDDVFVTNQQGPNTLYFNLGNETFEQRAGFENLQLAAQRCHGVSVADYNNDGWQDMYLNCVGNNHLFENAMGQGFLDVTSSAQVNDTNNSQVSAWADINNDGWLDIYVVNYNDGVNSLAAEDSLFFSDGTGGFVEVSSDLDTNNLLKPGLAVTFFDYDNDGDQDLYVVVDRFFGNVLWRNDGPPTASCGTHWCWTDVSALTQANAEVYGMGIATGDIDGDGDLDMYFTSIDEQKLLLNQWSDGQAVFLDVSQGSVLNAALPGWASLFFDYDNDGYLDALLASWGTEEHNADKIFKGNGNGTFTDVTAGSGLADLSRTEGFAAGDFNHDGLLDLIRGNTDEGYHLLKNIGLNSHHWITLELKGAGPVNANAIGTRVTAHTLAGTQIIREATSGDSRGSGNQLAMHFGLGQHSLEYLQINWPDGTQEQLTDFRVDRNNVILYP